MTTHLRWNRSASQLGDRECERRIQQNLEKLYPPAHFPFHVDVVGGQHASGATIRIWDGRNVNVSEQACPEDFVTSPDGPRFTAVMSKVIELVRGIRL
jgi:hypothetical protein